MRNLRIKINRIAKDVYVDTNKIFPNLSDDEIKELHKMFDWVYGYRRIDDYSSEKYWGDASWDEKRGFILNLKAIRDRSAFSFSLNEYDWNFVIKNYPRIATEIREKLKQLFDVLHGVQYVEMLNSGFVNSYEIDGVVVKGEIFEVRKTGLTIDSLINENIVPGDVVFPPKKLIFRNQILIEVSRRRRDDRVRLNVYIPLPVYKPEVLVRNGISFSIPSDFYGDEMIPVINNAYARLTYIDNSFCSMSLWMWYDWEEKFYKVSHYHTLLDGKDCIGNVVIPRSPASLRQRHIEAIKSSYKVINADSPARQRVTYCQVTTLRPLRQIVDAVIRSEEDGEENE